MEFRIEIILLLEQNIKKQSILFNKQQDHNSKKPVHRNTERRKARWEIRKQINRKQTQD